MAFENGYCAEDYIEECIKKYNVDSLIFTKALGVINMFSNQPEWPHNYEVMKKSLLPILGNDIEWIVRFSQQWLSQNENTRQIEWPAYTSDNFLDDLRAFSYAVSDLLERVSASRINPLGFYSIVRSTHSLRSDKQKLFRIIRMDGEKFDINLSRSDIKYIISVFDRVLQDNCELE